MSRRNYAKHKFIMSVLALVLSIAMLIGTTFAWFTDSVTSGKNTITAGNLDVELTHYTDDATAAETVQDATDLFDVDLWEPGVVAYENFVISNKGSLALKYVLDLSVFDCNTFGGKNLTEVIKVAKVDGGFTGDREAAKALSYESFDSFQKSGSLAAEADDVTFGVVLYWEPTDHDNDYNVNNGGVTSDGNPLYVELGVNLRATQLENESDSFDETYDKNATYPPLVKPIQKAETKPASVDADSKTTATVELSGGTIPAGTTLYTDNSKEEPLTDVAIEGKLTESVSTTGNADSFTLSIGFTYVNGTTETEIHGFSEALTRTFDLSTGLKDVKVKHGTVDMTSGTSVSSLTDGQYFYDATSGKLTIKSSTFSDFIVTYATDYYFAVDGQGYNTLQEAANGSKQGDTVTLLKDLTSSKSISISNNDKGINLNLNGKTIECTDTLATLYIDNDSYVASVYNGTLKGAKPVRISGSNAHVGEIKDCNLVCASRTNDGIYLNGICDKITNVKLTGTCKNAVDIVKWHSGTTVIDGLTSEVDISSKDWLYINQGGVEIKNATVKEGEFGASDPGTISITGGTYAVDPSAYVASGYTVKQAGDKYKVVGLWPAYAAENFAAIDTSAKTITINAADQLALLAKNINAGTDYSGYTITIDGALDMSAHPWVPINAYQQYEGKLSGSTIVGTNSAKISGLDIDRAVNVRAGGYDYYAAFIAQVTGTFTIKDITFEGAVSVSNGSGIAVVLGLCYGNTTMENIAVKNSTITAETKAGAFVGFTGGDGYKVTLKNCSVENVTVNSVYSYALMVGLVNINDSAELSDCTSANSKSVFNGTETSFEKYIEYEGLTYGVDDGKLWLTDPKGAWVEKRSNPSPTAVIEGITYTIKGDKVLNTNGTIGEN